MPSKTRRNKNRKHTKRHRQKGGMTESNIDEQTGFILDLFQRNPKNPRSLKNFILNRTNRDNDENYTWFKYTTIPAGTFFRFRSHEKIKALKRKSEKEAELGRGALWVDYTESLGKPSFEAPNARVDPTVAKGMSNRFGEWLNIIRTLKPLKILHFPVDYRYTNKGNKFSFTSEFEKLISILCASDDSNVYDPENICVDGYTLDFLYRSMESQKPPFDNAPFLLEGFRELAILNPQPGVNIELVSSEYKPVP